MHSMMPAVGLNWAMRRRSSSVSPSLLVMKMVLARARWEGGSRKRAAREQPLVAKGLLAVNQHDVLPPAPQFPVLEPVVEQERVTAEFLDGVAAALDAVLVHQHHDVLEVGCEHVRFVAGHFRIRAAAICRPTRRAAAWCHPRKKSLLSSRWWTGVGLER